MPKQLFEKQLQNENMLRRNENIVEDGTSLGKSNRVERMEERAVLLHLRSNVNKKRANCYVELYNFIW